MESQQARWEREEVPKPRECRPPWLEKVAGRACFLVAAMMLRLRPVMHVDLSLGVSPAGRQEWLLVGVGRLQLVAVKLSW